MSIRPVRTGRPAVGLPRARATPEEFAQDKQVGAGEEEPEKFPEDEQLGSDGGRASASKVDVNQRQGRAPQHQEGTMLRPNISSRFINFVREVVAELQKVIWPTRKELLTYTAVVVVFVAIMMTFVPGLTTASRGSCSSCSATRPRPERQTGWRQAVRKRARVPEYDETAEPVSEESAGGRVRGVGGRPSGRPTPPRRRT